MLRERRERFAFQVNEHVLAETQEILVGKLKEQTHLSTTLYILLGVAGVQTVPNPSKSRLTSIGKIISKKDAPILLSAMEYSDCLLTLDNEFFKPAVIRAARERDLQILKPGDLIRSFDL